MAEFEEELDFEVEEEELEEYYCSVCSECFDTEKEFTEHTNSTSHNAQLEQKLTSLETGDSFCNLCFVKITGSFEDHCKTTDHCEYLNAIKRCFPTMSEPIEDIYDSSTKKQTKAKKSTASKTGSLKERIFAQKCIGVTHLKRMENLWFCDLCLEKFPDSTIDEHCTRANHAIQCIKLYEPETAYKLKVYALQSHLKKKFHALVSAKATEIFDKEKESPDFLRFMLELDRFEKPVVKSEPLQTSAKSVVKITKSATKALPIRIPEKKDVPNLDKEVSPDIIGEVVSLFEEDDRSFIPSLDSSLDNIKTTKVAKSSKGLGNNVPIMARDSTMILGIKYLKLKGRNYYCNLCDVICKSALSSCRGHMTSSLHRRKMINQNSAHPIPNYLEKLRTKDAILYNKLVKIEARKIELAERSDENGADMKTRAGILSLSNVQCLPKPLANVEKLPVGEQKLNLEQLAKSWDKESNQQVFNKAHVDSPSTGTNKTAISPIHPQIEDLLVGVNAISHISGSNFHCSLCNIKFTIQAKRKQRPHVTGRLHKLKALAEAYGKDVDDYLNYRMKKEGYEKMVIVINQACVPLEKEEIESETPALREIRAKILGVKVEQLPLPLIIMSNEKPFDVRKAAAEWKPGKKIGSSNTTNTNASKSSAKLKQDSVAEKLLAEANLKSKNKKVAKPDHTHSKTEAEVIRTHIDVQSFDNAPKPAEIIVEVKNDRAKNIFDLCKPLPNTTPEKKSFKSSKSPSSIKNIDIDVLRKSLVDADFIPVEKADPKKDEEVDGRKKKASAEEDTPKSSKSATLRNKPKPSGSSKPDQKPDQSASQQNKHRSRSPIQKITNIVKESPRRTYTAARNTYVKAEVNNRQNNTKPKGDAKNFRDNSAPSQRPSQDQRNSQNQGQIRRDGPAIKTERGLVRENDRRNVSSNRMPNNNNRSLHNQCEQNKDRQQSNNYDGRRNQPINNQPTSNKFDNTSGGRYNQGDRNQQGPVPSRDQFNAPANNPVKNSGNYTDRNLGNTSDSRHGSRNSANQQSQYNNFGNNNPSRRNPDQRNFVNNSGGGRQNPTAFNNFGDNRVNNAAPIVEAFDIDMNTIKNTHLSTALAKVTTLGPLNPAHNPLTYNNNRQNAAPQNSFQRQNNPGPQNQAYNNRQQQQPGQSNNNYQGNQQNNRSFGNQQADNNDWGNSGRDNNWGNAGNNGRHGQQQVQQQQNNTWDNNKANCGASGPAGNQYQSNYDNEWQNNDHRNNNNNRPNNNNNRPNNNNNNRPNNDWGNDRDKGWGNNDGPQDNRVGMKREGYQPYGSPQKRPRQFRS